MTATHAHHPDEDREHVAESLTKGTRVIVQGRLVQRSFETREGEKRTVVELQVEEVGPSLRYATAAVTRSQRGSNGGGQQRAASGFGHPAPDAWSTPAPAGGGFTDEPPF